MRVVVQRVSKASVEIDGIVRGEIDQGFLLLVGIEEEDAEEDVRWLAKKIISLRIFSDSEGKMNLDIEQVGGNILVISQFTLHAKYKKGTRPSFIKAARPEQAIPLYELFKKELSKSLGKNVAAGEFGAMMAVSLVNDGPVTLLLDTKNKQ